MTTVQMYGGKMLEGKEEAPGGRAVSGGRGVDKGVKEAMVAAEDWRG